MLAPGSDQCPFDEKILRAYRIIVYNQVKNFPNAYLTHCIKLHADWNTNFEDVTTTDIIMLRHTLKACSQNLINVSNHKFQRIIKQCQMAAEPEITVL